MNMKVFVYGTLKQGYINHWYLRNALKIVPAKVWGRIYNGGFPTVEISKKSILANGTDNHLEDSQTQAAMSINGKFNKPRGDWDIVHGELVTLSSPKDMVPLDRLEGFRPDDDGGLYNRSLVEVSTENGMETAWIYWSPRAKERGNRILSGLWENVHARNL